MKKKVSKKKASVKKATPKKTATPAKKGVLPNQFGCIPPDYPEPGKFCVLYGPPGEGKTTVAAHVPHPLFICTADEQGIKQAITAGVVPEEVRNYIVELDPLCTPGNIPSKTGVLGWIKAVQTVTLFADGDHDRRTLVVDTLSGLWELCTQHCASMLYEGDMTSYGDGKFMSYYSGYRKSAEQFWQGEFLTACSRAVSRGLNVVLLAHSDVVDEPNTMGPEYKKFNIDIDRRAGNFTKKAAQGILFMGRVPTLKAEKGKAKASKETRIIGVQKTPWYEAKNWYNLSEHIEAGTSAKETWEKVNAVLKFK